MTIYYVVGNKRFYGSEIKKKGEIDISRFHKEILPWFREYKYSFHERDITSRDTPSGKDQKIEWTAYRNIDGFFRINIDVRTDILRWRGKRAEVTVRFKGYLETDYYNKFIRKFPSWGKFFLNIYEKYILYDKINVMQDKVRLETNDLINQTKKLLNLITR